MRDQVPPEGAACEALAGRRSVNWYKHYLGDYARDTAHLALLEHGAYRVLLDSYYATGRPLPHDMATLHRITRAATRADRAAVERVAEQFFPVSEDGLRHNKRADEEIAKHAAQVAINREIGRRGGRPRKTEPVSTEKPIRLLDENRTGYFPETEPITEPITEPKPNRNPNQSQRNTKEAEPAPKNGALDPVWGVGLRTLLDTGIPESSARSFIGLMLASWSEADVLDALQAASGKADVRSYVRAVLKAKTKKGESAERRLAMP